MRWRTLRGPVLVVGLLVATAAATALLAAGPSRGERLDPANTSLVGSRAIARLLENHGVTVERVDDPAVVHADPHSLLVVSAPTTLSPDAARRLAGLAMDRFVVGADLDGHLLGTLEPTGEVPPASRQPACDLGAARRAGSAYVGGLTFRGADRGLGCYPADGDPTMARRMVSGRTVTVVGDGSFLTNQRLAEDGNAALALNLLGKHPRVVWLVRPERPALAGPEGAGVGSLVPARAYWVVAQLALVVALLALWRGRRLGPVATEPLAVVVRASETVEGHGRLYHARRARDRAAQALRSAARQRIADTLGLPRTASVDALVSAVVGRTGADPTTVHAVLGGPPPRNDRELVRLAEDLDVIEEEVRKA